MTDLLHLAADIMPGLLDGWVGPVRLRTDTVPYAVASSSQRADGHAAYQCAACVNQSVLLCAIAENMTFDLRRPECRDRVARVLAAAGHPVWHLLDAERDGRLTPEGVGACIGWSARSVAAGGGVLIDVGGEWKPYTRDSQARICVVSRNVLCRVGMSGFFVAPGWEALTSGMPRGQEVGGAGMDRADRAVLAAGFALRDPDGLRFPELKEVKHD